jgi:antitoxin component HigA of HigAB toxin-antitoxin module
MNNYYHLPPIQSEEVYLEALAVIDLLLDLGHPDDLEPYEEEFLDALSDRVWNYEQEHYSI